jgi:alpha-D-ribose 1-methylphosphonate 5-triphosphate synthase subunit PhnG
MTDLNDRTERFELIAGTPRNPLVEHAEAVLDGDSTVRVLQAPSPQLLMHRVTEPVERRPFNLGEVLVTTAEVELDGAERGYAMIPGRARAKAVAGAVVDAAVAADHARRDDIAADLRAAEADREERRRRQWAESRATTVEFDTMEDDA